MTDSLAPSNRVVVIGIAGGSGSGKTTLARAIAHALGPTKCAVLTQDSFYVDQSARFDGDGGSVNFDAPSSLDFALLEQTLLRLKAGQQADVPIYDFATHKRRAQCEYVAPLPAVIVDGTLILDAANVRQHFDVTVFVEAEERVRFERRLERDVRERGRTADGVERQFTRQVKPMHDQYVEPSKAHATLRVSGTATLDEGLRAVLRELSARGLVSL